MSKVLAFVVVVAVGCKPAEKCDDRVEDRQRWFTAQHDEYRGRRPSDGLRALGNCADEVVQNMLSCDQEDVRRVVGDSPYLHDALALGFKTYICELASDHYNRTTYPLADVLTKRAGDAAPPPPGVHRPGTLAEAMAKMDGFKTAMCACKDKACAENVDMEMKSYSDSMKGKHEKGVKMSADDEKRMMQMVTEFSNCQQLAMDAPPTSADRPGTVDEAMAKVESYAAAMCSCGNRACAVKVDREMKARANKLMKTGATTTADAQMLTFVALEYAKCQKSAMTSP